MSGTLQLTGIANPATFFFAPTGGDDAPSLQIINDQLREANGGTIELYNSALYRLDTPLILDVGAGVALKGNQAWLDARNISGTNVAILLTSRAPTTPKIAGIDTSTENYLQKAAYVEGIRLIGNQGGSQTHHGIEINMVTQIGGRAPRPTIRNISVIGFDRQIRHRNEAYLVTIRDSAFSNCRKCLSYEGGVDQGENTLIDHCAFFEATDALLYFDTQPETGTTENVELTFESCSFDYPSNTTSKMIQYVSGLGRCRFNNCHFEWSVAGDATNSPFDLATAAAHTMHWWFDKCLFVHTGTRSYTAPFKIGNLHDVRIHDAHIHTVGGAGVQVSATGGPGGAATTITTMAELTGTGTFYMRDTAISDNPGAIPRVPDLSDANNWLSDPGFEDASLLDMWWVTGNTGAPATSATIAHTGSRSLRTTTTATGAKTLRVLVPVARGARFASAAAFVRVSSGTPSVSLNLRPVVAVETTPGSAPTIRKTGSTTVLNSATMDSTGFVLIAQTTNTQRVAVPAWATHVEVWLDLVNVGSGVAVDVDPVFVCGW